MNGNHLNHYIIIHTIYCTIVLNVALQLTKTSFLSCPARRQAKLYSLFAESAETINEAEMQVHQSTQLLTSLQ